MKKIALLSALAVLVAGSSALWSSPSHSAPKGRTASPPPSKSMVATPSRAPVRPGKG
jgi:hypothetical protein